MTPETNTRQSEGAAKTQAQRQTTAEHLSFFFNSLFAYLSFSTFKHFLIAGDVSKTGNR